MKHATNGTLVSYLARRLTLLGQRWDWLARCQYTVIDEEASLICRFYHGVVARTRVNVDPFLRNTGLMLGRSACCLLVGCLTSQQHASESQGRICTDNFTCCHTEIEAADPTFHLTQSQYTDTGPTSPSADPITPGAWQGSHWSANF